MRLLRATSVREPPPSRRWGARRPEQPCSTPTAGTLTRPGSYRAPTRSVPAGPAQRAVATASSQADPAGRHADHHACRFRRHRGQQRPHRSRQQHADAAQRPDDRHSLARHDRHRGGREGDGPYGSPCNCHWRMRLAGFRTWHAVLGTARRPIFCGCRPCRRGLGRFSHSRLGVGVRDRSAGFTT